MKITKIEVAPVSLKYQPGNEFRVSYGILDSMDLLVVKLHGEDGVVGFSEVMCYPWAPDQQDRCTKEIGKVSKSLLGQDVFGIRDLHRKMDAVSEDIWVKGALDFAIHDLAAKAAGIPLYKFLGGTYKGGRPLHFSLSIKSPEEMGEDARAKVAIGFQTLEVKLGRFLGELDLDTEVERVRAIRKGAGPDTCVVIDPNAGWTAEETLKVVERMEEFDVLLEQPCLGIEEMRKVRKATSMKLIADENAGSPEEVAELARGNVVDMINIKVLRVGGIHRAMQILDTLASFGISYRHDNVIYGRLNATTGLHFAIAYDQGLPDAHGTQFTRTTEDLAEEGTGLKLDGGVASLFDPEAPGIGAVPREDLLGTVTTFR